MGAASGRLSRGAVTGALRGGRALRTRCVASVVSALVLAAGLGAARADAMVSRPVSGLGKGSSSVDCLGCGGLLRGDSGRYASVGQLGSGSYSFNSTIGPACGAGNRGVEFSGTASFSRADGAQLSGKFDECVPSHPVSADCASAGCPIDDTPIPMHLSGGARDLISADLTVTFFYAGNTVAIPDGDLSDEQLAFTGSITVTRQIGYWMLDTSGRVYGFGGGSWHGNATTPIATRDLAPTPSGSGYWVVNVDGQVYAFGDARWLGNANRATFATGEQVTGIAATPSGRGYWLFTTLGRVLPFGDAPFIGDLHATRLNGPIVNAVATTSGAGYYMVGTDGGVFSFGDARFRGSMGGRHLNAPVIALVPTADNRGYWLVAADGGIFAFSAPYLGSLGGIHLNAPITGMDRYGTGYLMVATDGGIFNFSHQPYFGSLGATPPPNPVFDLAAIG